MNERIKQLAEQAGMHDFVLEAMGIGEEFENFAELIVRECENSIKLVPTHNEAQDKIIVECLKAIRETFRS
jgi:L-asparaginase/Glu-tRNA(Gln) amidotransferase subunit D